MLPHDIHPVPACHRSGGCLVITGKTEDGNALTDARTEFVVVMMCAPGEPMLKLVDEAELAERAHLRAPRPTA
jgi:hypothetical protein